MDLGDTHNWASPVVPTSPGGPSSSNASSKPSSVHPDDDESLVEVLKTEQQTFFQTRLKFPLPLALFFSSNLLPDSLPNFKLCNQTIFPSKQVVRGVKFYVMTFTLIYALRYYVKSQKDLEVDKDLNLSNFKEFYFLPCLQDTLVYFLLGRLYKRRGCDCLNIFLPMVLGACFMSWLGYIPALNTSFTKSSIENQWTTETWIYSCSLASIVFGFVIALAVVAAKEGILFSRFMEFLVVSFLAIHPLAESEDFHPHHWFLAILIGVHVNQRFWWSLMLQSFMWGVYINGIAVYGRDGLMGCDEVKYRAGNLGCAATWYDDDS
ncbi:hypothetical protein TrLO_g2265 [Triparma laevis f. longispina]|uniref:Uncharacterized protein n=1 Tax=Triparma laevis f. longispina TaxID=1714387 RepID=A0A9W7CG49_9STRA|nr:hypothetical protein TrLO_g2265 [Triparma laevis f. longispina]